MNYLGFLGGGGSCYNGKKKLFRHVTTQAQVLTTPEEEAF